LLIRISAVLAQYLLKVTIARRQVPRGYQEFPNEVEAVGGIPKEAGTAEGIPNRVKECGGPKNPPVRKNL
jgi:hypothetical protein